MSELTREQKLDWLHTRLTEIGCGEPEYVESNEYEADWGEDGCFTFQITQTCEEAAKEITRLRAQLAKAHELSSDLGEAIGIEIVEVNELQSAIDGLFEMQSQIQEWKRLAEAEGQAVGEIAIAGDGQIWGFLNGPNEGWSVGDELYTHPAPAKVPEGYALVPVEPTDKALHAMQNAIEFYCEEKGLPISELRKVYRAMLKSQGGE